MNSSTGPDRRAFALRVACLYALAAGGWIAVSDLVLGQIFQDALPITLASLAKGLVFVGVTGLLLYLFLVRVPLPDIAGRSGSPSPVAPGLLSRNPIVVFLLLAAALLAGTIAIFWRDSATHLRAAQERLEMIGEWKARQVELWLGHQEAVALSYSGARLPRMAATEIARTGASPQAADLQRRLEEFRTGLDAVAVSVIDVQGRQLANAGNRIPVSGELAARVAEVVHKVKPAPHLLHRNADSPQLPVSLDFVVPWRAEPEDGSVIGALVVRHDASGTLSRLAGTWPTSSRSGEIFLARREGEKLVHLTRLRHRPAGDPVLSNAILASNLPVAQIARGERNAVRGIDYRGVEVLAFGRRIEGTDWSLVAKEDVREILEDVRTGALFYAALVLGLTLLAGAGTTMLWHQQGRYAALRERTLVTERDALGEHLVQLSRHANDAILLVDEEGRVVEANEKAVEQYGYPRKVLIGMHAAKLRSPEENSSLRERFAEIRRTGKMVSESLHARSDGTEFPVEISGWRVDAGEKTYIQAIIRDISERVRSESALRASEATYRSLFDNMLNGLAYCQMLSDNGHPSDFVYLSVNRAFETLTGLKNVIGRRVTEVIPGIRESDPELFRFYGGVATTGQAETAEVFVAAVKEWFSISAYCPRPGFFVAVFDVITQRKQAEARIARLQRLRNALGACNRAITKAQNDDMLFQEMCEIVVNYAGYLFAWIGLADQAHKLVRPVAHAGKLPGYLSALRVTLDDTAPEGHGLIAEALRSGRLAVSQDYGSDPRLSPWHALAKDSGIRSMAAVPLRRMGQPIGSLIVYAGEPNAFDNEYVALLEEMASDVSFALDGMQRIRELRESEERFRAMLEQSIAAVYVIQDGQIVYVNPRMREIFGYAPDEPFNPDPLAHVAEAERAMVAEQMVRRPGGEPVSAYSVSALRKDGTTFTMGVHAKQASYRGMPAIIAIAQDITEKAHAEEEIKRYLARLEKAMRSTIEVVSSIGEMRDPYTYGHERRVGEIATSIAVEMGMDIDRVEGIRVAGYLHDVGKIGVPAEILSKPSRLSKAEFDLVKDHAQRSYEILKKVEFPWPVAEAAWQHHERLDGSGYPRGLKGEQIILEARILAVADTVEAMASHRPYRPGLGIDKALAEIKQGRDKTFDPQVVDACLRLFHDKNYTIPD